MAGKELKAAGLVVEDVKKSDHRKLQFGRNNPENTWAERFYDVLFKIKNSIGF